MLYSEKIIKILISEVKCVVYIYLWKFFLYKFFKSFNKLGEEFFREGKVFFECVIFFKGLFNKLINLKEKIV